MNAILKTRALTTFAVIVMLTGPAVAGRWELSFEQARTRAKQNGLPLLIHFHATWCGPCQQMESSVLNQPQVTNQLGNSLIGVKVNTDVRRDLVSSFGVTSLPADILLTPDGRTVKRSSGARSLSSYSQLLSGASAYRIKSMIAAKPVLPGRAGKSVASSKPRMSPRVTNEPKHAEKERTNDTAVADSASPPRECMAVIDGVRLGLHGFCPVSLSQATKWVNGSTGLQEEFEGVSYRFASEADRQRFKARPENYVPALHGHDVVSLARSETIRAGLLSIGARYQGRLYFFSSKANRETFVAAPSQYAKAQRLTFYKSASASSEKRPADQG